MSERTYRLAVVELGSAVFIGQTLVVSPGEHPVPRQLPRPDILEGRTGETGPVSVQGLCQGDQGDVVTSEVSIIPTSSVGVSVSYNAPDLAEGRQVTDRIQ